MKWREDIFDNFVRLKRGFDLPEAKLEAGPYPVVASASITAYHKDFKVKGPGVVTGRSGSLGTVQYVAGDYWPHNTALYVRDFHGNFPRYTYYFLQKMRLENFNSGAGVPTLNQNHLHKLKIRIPSVHVQKRIAAVLWAYDDLIENHKRRIALLERLAEEIYREWFVRLRFPGHEKVKVVKGVPETWDNTRFGKFCMLKRGYDLPDKRVVPGEYPVMASTSIKTYHNEFKVRPPVITTGRSGSLGTVQMVHSKAWPLNTALYVKDFFGNSPYLVYYTLKNMGLETFDSGAGVPTLNRNHINGIKIAVPDKDLQGRFDLLVAPVHEQQQLIRKANIILTAAQEALLLRLISGKLSVENLSIQFPPQMSEELNVAPLATANA
jgi:type I restriction enzyme S subunit